MFLLTKLEDPKEVMRSYVCAMLGRGEFFMNTDVLIIGGGPAGFACAKSASHTYPDKKISLVRKDPVSVIPCGIPYVISSLKEVEHNILPDKGLVDDGINIIIDEITGFSGENSNYSIR